MKVPSPTLEEQKTEKKNQVKFTNLEPAFHWVISAAPVYFGTHTHLNRVVREMMTYLPGSVWIVVRHVEAVFNKTKEIKTVRLEWTLKVPQPWHIFRYMLNHCRDNRHKCLQKTSEGGHGACSPSLALTLTARSLQVPNRLPKFMMFLVGYSWPYLYVKIMCRWGLVAISTSYSLIPCVYCFLMNSEMVFKLARLGWEAQEVLKLFCITLGRKAIKCAILCPPVRASESHSALVKVQ